MKNQITIPFPIAGGSNNYLDPQFSAEKTINMYVDTIPGGKDQALVMIPGSKSAYTNVNGERTRALHVENAGPDFLFSVYEDEVVRQDPALSGVVVGTLDTTAGHVGIASNNTKQITFVDNVDGWVYDYNGAPTFTKITSPGFPSAPADCDFIDGRILVAQSSTNRWYASNIDDATTYDALNFASLTSDEEKLVGLRIVKRRIFIFWKIYY